MLDTPNATAACYTLGTIIYPMLQRRLGEVQAAAFVAALDGATRPGTPERAAQDRAWQQLNAWFSHPQPLREPAQTSRAPREHAGRNPASIAGQLRAMAPGEVKTIVGMRAGGVAARANGLGGRGAAMCRTVPGGVLVTRMPLGAAS